MIAYNPGQPSLLLSNPTQPVYTIAYRANNGGSVLTSNILSGPAAATYVTAPRRPKGAEVTLPNYDNDHEDQDRPIVPRQTYLKKVGAHSRSRLTFHAHASRSMLMKRGPGVNCNEQTHTHTSFFFYPSVSISG